MLTSYEQGIVDGVQKFGWYVISVAPVADTPGPTEHFTYTIGLPTSYGWPEFICFGLGPDNAHDLLDVAVKQLRAAKVTPYHGLMLAKVIQSADVRFVDAAHIPDSYFNSARWFARHNGSQGLLPRLQMLWPDQSGRYPDDPLCAPEARAAQTPLKPE
jgi:Domain of unknown function (DUF4262)